MCELDITPRPTPHALLPFLNHPFRKTKSQTNPYHTVAIAAGNIQTRSDAPRTLVERHP